MNAKIKHRILKAYRSLFGYGSTGFKKVVRSCSNHQNYTGVLLDDYRFIISHNLDASSFSKEEVRRYRARWKQLSPWLPKIYLKMFPPISGVKSPDFVPKPLYFNLVEPLLNNWQFSRSFADKNMYGKLVDPDVLPAVLLRKMHGQYYDGQYNPVFNVDAFISSESGPQKKYIIKPAVESQGGRSVASLESGKGALWLGERKISQDWLDRQYRDNFLIQEYIHQHPFYAALNESSLNSLRIYTYRSVKDNVVHFIYATIRVGKPGAVTDNIATGGKAIALKPDGTLMSRTPDIAGEVCCEVEGLNLGENVKAVGFDAIKETALRLAANQYYSRFLTFDFCYDQNEKVRLIELNNFDIGVTPIQTCSGPLFGKFTDEVIEYCQEKKQGYRYLIR